MEGGFGDSPENRKGNRRICWLGMKVVNGEKETVPKRGGDNQTRLDVCTPFLGFSKGPKLSPNRNCIGQV